MTCPKQLPIHRLVECHIRDLSRHGNMFKSNGYCRETLNRSCKHRERHCQNSSSLDNIVNTSQWD